MSCEDPPGWRCSPHPRRMLLLLLSLIAALMISRRGRIVGEVETSRFLGLSASGSSVAFSEDGE